MIGHVPLPDVMRRLFQEPAYSSREFGHLRPLLTDLLRTCQYERVLCDSARRIVQADTWHGHLQKRRAWSRGYGAPERCHVCGRRPDLQAGQMIAFRCGHFCHPGCAPERPSGRPCAVCGDRARPVPSPDDDPGPGPQL
ncbi:uncharacterized protein LOC119089782 [Pollicipes pollicipes]|uniref:uncharacterized protein LOC119089782 n=1 Tax=Pollicipes pollicipes TaxID=41117 RepID=UPI001884A3A1|nr:uncharacterized protein LOC119089782 [Pollicipes pollicipes]